jgi:hypothetical protein
MINRREQYNRLLWQSWPWSYGSWIYNYLCNQCLSPLMFSQVTDKLYQIMLYNSPWSRFEFTTSVVIGTDCIGSYKSSYHTITATTATVDDYIALVCCTSFLYLLLWVRIQFKGYPPRILFDVYLCECVLISYTFLCLFSCHVFKCGDWNLILLFVFVKLNKNPLKIRMLCESNGLIIFYIKHFYWCNIHSHNKR